MQKFSTHQVTVGRAILSTLFGVTTKRTRLEGGNYLYTTTDHEPRDAARLATKGGWFVVPSFSSACHFRHASYPGALLEVAFDELGKRRSQCALMLRDAKPVKS